MHVRELANELTSRNERIDTTSPVPLPRKLLFVSVGQLLETEFKHGEETRPSRVKGIPQVCPSLVSKEESCQASNHPIPPCLNSISSQTNLHELRDKRSNVKEQWGRKETHEPSFVPCACTKRVSCSRALVRAREQRALDASRFSDCGSTTPTATAIARP